MLFGVEHNDPTTYVTSVALVLLLGAAASFLPATRATHVDPSRSLNDS